MTLEEYAAKWNRDPEHNFAIHCYRRWQAQELQTRDIELALMREHIDSRVFAGWEIDEREAREALSAVLIMGRGR